MIIGIDLGTQSIKVIVYDPHTRVVVAKASHALELITRDDGSAEQHAQWWIDGLLVCLSQIDPEIRAKVVAIGVSGQQHGFVPVSGQGEVLAPVKLWCDTSTTLECEDITQSLGGEPQCIALAGNPIAAGFTASKILWLKNNKPNAYAQMATIMLPHDYLNFYLTGISAMEFGDASGTALLDVRNRTWSTPILQAIDPERDLRACLPPLVESHQVLGNLLPARAEELGLSADVVVATGGGDNMMAAIGTGNVREGRLTASMGTSGTLFAHSDTPVVDDRAELAAFCSSSGAWMPLLCTMNCTVATEQVRTLFNLDLESLGTLAADIPPGADGVLTLPFYNGERTPPLPHAKAVVYGMDMTNTSPAHFARSAMESAVFGLRTGLLAFERLGMKFSELTLTGGGSESALWRQIVADVLALPVKVLKEKENAAFGAVLQALWVYRLHSGDTCKLGDVVDEHLSIDEDRCCVPDQENLLHYQQVYSDYQALLAALSPLYSQLNK